MVGSFASLGVYYGVKHIANHALANAVIKETLRGRGNIVSIHKLNNAQANLVKKKFLGKSFNSHPKQVFTKNVGGNIRVFRMDTSSMLGLHKPHVAHFHLEIFGVNTKKANMIVNNHIPFIG